MNILTFVDREAVLELRKTDAGHYTGHLRIECSDGDDDESYREVRLYLTPDQQDKLKARLASNEATLTLTDEDRTLSLYRRDTGLDLKCRDAQTWMAKPAKPTAIEIEMTLKLAQMGELTKWL
jgi:hypothetical protein